jgi:hypothetical protein
LKCFHFSVNFPGNLLGLFISKITTKNAIAIIVVIKKKAMVRSIRKFAAAVAECGISKDG